MSSVFTLIPLALLGAGLLAALEALLAGRMFGGRWRARLLLAPGREALRHLYKGFRPGAGADRPLWLAGPLLLVGACCAALALLPPAAAAGSAAGAVLITALLALAAPALLLAGWGPNAHRPLLAGWRYAALRLAYGIPFTLVVIAAALPARSLSLAAIAEAQAAGYLNLLIQPLGFLIYLLCALALAFRGPFAVADARELGGGIEGALSGAPLLLWRLGRQLLLLVLAALAAVLYLAGDHGPGLPAGGWLALKTALIAALLIWGSQAAARVQLAHFMRGAWIGLVPLALLNLFATGFLLLILRGGA